MGRFIGGFVVFVMACAFQIPGAYAAETGAMRANLAPEVTEIKGEGAIHLAAVLTHTYTGACAHLFSSNQPIGGSPSGPTKISDLITTIKIPEAYRTSAKVLVTWTLRVEGTCRDLSEKRESTECEGITTLSCPKGNVNSVLYVNDKLMEPPYVIEVPGGSGGSIELYPPPPPPISFLHDPTLTGTYLIKPADFGGALPAELKIQVAWQNFTALDITCPDGMRNLITHLMPIVKED